MAEGDADLADLYREVLVDYFRSGAHRGSLPEPDMRSHGVNPVCGDEIELSMSAPAGRDRIERIRFSGHGCVISQASAAIMAEALEGESPRRASELAAAFKDMMLRRLPLESLPGELEEARALEGVRKFPVRIKCALLAWNTLLEGLKGSRRGAVSEFQEVV